MWDTWVGLHALEKNNAELSHFVLPSSSDFPQLIFLPISNIQILIMKSYLNFLRKHTKLSMNMVEERLPGFWNISPIPEKNFENQLAKEFLESNKFKKDNHKIQKFWMPNITY